MHIQHADEQYYYDLTEKDYLWKNPDMLLIIDAIRDVMRGTRGRVLEIGCGLAGIIPHLPQGIEYVGTDTSEYGIDRSRMVHQRHDARFEVMGAESLAFEAHSFDAVLAFNVIEHCSYPRKVLDEMIRVARPGGILVLTGPNLDLPSSLSNGIRHRNSFYRTWIRLLRCVDYVGRVFGVLKFRTIEENYAEATGRYEKPDDDLRYYCSAFEVIEYCTRAGCRIKYVSPPPATTDLRSRIKGILTRLPGMRYYGRGLHVILQTPGGTYA